MATVARQQKAIVVTEVGKPVSATTRPIPTPKENEVLVKITAAHLLPHDAYGRDRGLFIGAKLPWVPGGDIAGTIVELGPRTSDITTTTTFKPGDRIFGIENLLSTLPDSGGCQEFVAIPITHIAKIPDGYTDEDASTFPINLMTSFMALFTKDFGFGFPAPWEDGFNSAEEKTVVIVAAGSNAGKFGVQLARFVGVGRIIAIAGASNESELLRIGATHFVDRHGSIEDITAQVHAITGPEGVTNVYDCYSWTYELGLSLLSPTKASRFVTLHRVDGDEVKKIRPLCEATYVQCTVANLAPHAEGFWGHVSGWLEQGVVLPAEWKVIGNLDDVEAVNAALDGYQSARGGPQAIVKP